MSVYRFNQNSLIDEVTFVKTDGGGIRAYLRAAAPDNALLALRERMDVLGWQNVPMTKDGALLLEVRGFKNEAVMLGQLKGQRLIEGAPEIQRDGKITFWNKLMHNRLFLCGVLNLLADGGIIMYNYLDKYDPKREKKAGDSHWQGLASSAAYISGSSVLFGFGHADKSDQQLKDMALQMQAYAASKGLQVPDTAAVESFAVDHVKGFKDNVHDNLKRYNSEIYNTLTALAGFFIGWDALKHDKYPEDPKKNLWHRKLDTTLGASTVTAGLTAAYIKEKAKEPGQPRRGGLAGIWGWIQERPNRIAGYGYMISSLAHGTASVDAFRKAKKEKYGYGMFKHAFRGWFVVVNLLGELVLATASKGHGAGVKSDPGMDLTACAVAADFIVTLPAPQREVNIQEFGKLLANPEILGGDANAVTACIREQVAAMEQSPWVRRNHINGAGKSEAAVLTRATPQKSSAIQWEGRVVTSQQQPAVTT